MRLTRGLVWVAGAVAACGGCADRVPITARPAGEPVARGVVYEDANGNGQRDAGERGLAGVRVSNGREVVRTDRSGRYELPVDDETIVFVIKPAGWGVRRDGRNVPQFHYLHKPHGSPPLKYGGVPPTGPLPAAVDFGLRRQHEPEKFDVLLLGDPQPRNLEEVDYVTRDIVEPLAGTRAAFAIAMGDNVFDDLSMNGAMAAALGRLGVPVYYVQGNHDMDYTATDDAHADDVFERDFGPPYYAFDYGRVHFLVLDDVVWEGEVGKSNKYHGGLGAEQLAFVRNDLALVENDRLVVLLMHIPIQQIEEKADLFRILARHPQVVSFSGHNHEWRHWFFDEEQGWPGPAPHHHVTVGATCGSWWAGAPDEAGIPHATMADGSPNGWAVLHVDGTRHTLELRPARRPADWQMNVYVLEPAVPATGAAADSQPAGESPPGREVVVNVFAGSERSSVEMRVDGGPWRRLVRTLREDPQYAALKAAEKGDPPPRGRKLPKVEKCHHLWQGELPADLPPGTHQLAVRTTDVYGQTYEAVRVFRIAASE